MGLPCFESRLLWIVLASLFINTQTKSDEVITDKTDNVMLLIDDVLISGPRDKIIAFKNDVKDAHIARNSPALGLISHCLSAYVPILCISAGVALKLLDGQGIQCGALIYCIFPIISTCIGYKAFTVLDKQYRAKTTQYARDLGLDVRDVPENSKSNKKD
jgi:hypothetical protein